MQVEKSEDLQKKTIVINVTGAVAIVTKQPVETNSTQGQFEDERFDRSLDETEETRFFLRLCSRHQRKKKMIFPVYLFFYCYKFYRGGEREEKRKTNKRRARKACENVE